MNIHKTCHQYIIIIADTYECIKALPSIFTYSTLISEGSKRSQRYYGYHSGKGILMIVTFPTSINDVLYDKSWDSIIHTKMKSYKPNVLKYYDTYFSKGACFSFGNKPFYIIVNNNSFGVYTNLKRNNMY